MDKSSVLKEMYNGPQKKYGWSSGDNFFKGFFVTEVEQRAFNKILNLEMNNIFNFIV